MNQCAESELKAAEAKMAALLKKLGVRSDDLAQKAWEAYRDSQLESIYPKENMGSYGSVFPMCFAILKTRLTEGRLRDLKTLTKSEEGDVCGGLRPIAAKRRNRVSAGTVEYSPSESHQRGSGGCVVLR
jgi:hypothetical protein